MVMMAMLVFLGIPVLSLKSVIIGIHGAMIKQVDSPVLLSMSQCLVCQLLHKYYFWVILSPKVFAICLN